MKRTNKMRLTALVVACVTIFMLSVSSYAESDWQEIATKDFSSSITIQKPELKARFDATVKNGELEIKSNDVCEWVANDLSSPKADANIADGITINGLGQRVTDYTYTYDGKTYDYVCGSDVGWLMEEIAGKKAMRMLTYPRYNPSNDTLDSRPLTSNYYKMKIVDNEKFLDNTSGTYEIELDYYVPANAAVSTLNVGSLRINSLAKGEWTTWKGTVTNPTLTGEFTLQMINIHPAYPVSATVYVNRFSIKKVKPETPVYSAKEKTAVMDLGIDNAFGNTAVSFDMTLPKTTKFTDTLYYNRTTKNSGRFGIADEDGAQLGAVQIDTKEDGTQVLYAVTGGDDELVEIYSGDILGKPLNYRFETDWVGETYTVAINYNGASISNEEEKFGPFAMTNAASTGNASVRTLRFVHNSTNTAFLTVIDNVVAEYIENPNYVMCKQDADSLVLDIPESGIVEDGFELPTTGETSGASITWSSSDPAAVISTDGDYCTISKGATTKDVTLTAIFEIYGIQVIKTVNITIEKHESQLAAEADVEAIVLDIPENGIVTEGFDLIKEGSENNSFISWSSNSPAVVVDNSEGLCTLVRGAERVNVTLTATAYNGDFTATKTFDVIVEKNESQIVAEAAAEAIELEIPDNMRIRENFELPTQVDGAAITWASSDESVLKPENGVAVVTRGQTDEIIILTATATVDGFTSSREYELIVVSLIGTYSNVGEVEETIVDGELSATVNIQSPGNSGTVHFAAVSIDPATGQIKDRESASLALTGDTRYSTIPLTITGLSVGADDEVEYYIWNDNRESLRNNAPGDVTGITAVGRGKGVRLDWLEALDDNNAIDGYAVYRDGEYVGSVTGSETTFLDEGAEVGVAHDYTIIAEDTNGFKGGSEVVEGEPALGMYYIDFHKKYSGEENYINGFLDFKFTESGDAYAFPYQVTDANGETYWVACTDKKYIMCNVDTTKVTGLDNELTIEVVYLDTSGTYDLYYNKKLPAGVEDDSANMFTYARAKMASVISEGGTRTWKTAIINLTDAQFRQKGSTGCDFAFYGGNVDKSMYIREIRIIQTPLYN